MRLAKARNRQGLEDLNDLVSGDLYAKRIELEADLVRTKSMIQDVNKELQARKDVKLSVRDDILGTSNITVCNQPLSKYVRTPSRNRVDTTAILNKVFTKHSPEPSVVPRQCRAMQIRNEATIRSIGRLSIEEMVLHSPTVLALRERAREINSACNRDKKYRMVFQSGFGYTWKKMPL